jgi:NmrA-like family
MSTSAIRTRLSIFNVLLGISLQNTIRENNLCLHFLSIFEVETQFTSHSFRKTILSITSTHLYTDLIMSLTLVGGTGGLGIEIAKGLIKSEGFSAYKAIVRNAEKGKVLQDMGWTLVEVPDYFDAVALESALLGTKTVVSTFGGDDLIKLDIATAHAAKKAGVELFVPSRFGIDHRRWSESNPFLASKLQVTHTAKEIGLPTLAVANGYFSDWIFDLVADPVNGKARIIGDGSAKITFTRRSDIGKVLAKALEDPDLMKDAVDGSVTLCIEGETLPYKDAVGTLEKVMGKKFDIEYIDPADALKQEKDLLAKGMEGDVGAFWGSFVLHLLGEPARGITGCDNSEVAKSYGVTLESLAVTLKSIYGIKD